MARDPFHKAFIPKSTKLPKSVLEYRTPLTLQLQPKELEQLCQAFELDELTTAQVGAIERATRGQSSSKTWFRQRAGRITASNLRRVLHTNAEKPAKALIKAICYPEAHRFSTAATTYLQGHQWFSEWYWQGLCSMSDHNGKKLKNKSLDCYIQYRPKVWTPCSASFLKNNWVYFLYFHLFVKHILIHVFMHSFHALPENVLCSVNSQACTVFTNFLRDLPLHVLHLYYSVMETSTKGKPGEPMRGWWPKNMRGSPVWTVDSGWTQSGLIWGPHLTAWSLATAMAMVSVRSR